MSPGEILAVCAILAVGSALQGAVGFGANLIAAPLVALIDPILVPGPLLVGGVLLTLLIVHREKQWASAREIGWALAGRMPGTVAGLIVLVVLSARSLELVFGLLVLAAVAMSAIGLRLAIKPGTLLTAGLFSGFMATTISVGGPPLALVYQHEEGPRLRGTLSSLLCVGAIVSFIGVVIIGRFGVDEIWVSLAILPAVIVGFAASTPLARVLDRGYTRPAILVLSGAAGIAVVVKALL